MTAREDFPQRLRKLLERKQISRKVLGELCGLSKNTIWRYEQGKRIPSIENARKLADFFDISLDALIGKDRE